MSGMILHPNKAVLENPGLEHFYDMRWRFDFKDRPSIICKKWGPSKDPEHQAWNKNKEGLVRACIEGKDRASGVVVTLTECDGHDFVNFQWIAEATTGLSFKRKISGNLPTMHRLLGMALVTREWLYAVSPTGEVFKKARPEAQKKINFATFGR